jgi:hypothetical protein
VVTTTVSLRDMKPGRRYRVTYKSGQQIGTFTHLHPGCCLQLSVKGNPFWSVPIAFIEDVQEVAR